jgi:hypothetical protein
VPIEKCIAHPQHETTLQAAEESKINREYLVDFSDVL